MEEKIWSLYVLECRDGSFYTGISPDPEKRYEAHRAGKGAAYTRTHEPTALLMIEVVGSYSQALRREWQVKRLSKSGKQEFIANPAALPPPSADARTCISKGRKKRRSKRASSRRRDP